MKSTDIKTAVKACRMVNQPVFIQGSPGIGKSEMIRQLADEIFGGEHIDKQGRYHGPAGQFSTRPYLIDIRVSQLDPVDLRGLPSIVDGKTIWNTPDFLPTEGEGIIFFDEVNSAPPMMQAPLYQIINDNRLGEWVKPDGWYIIAAGNKDTDRAITSRLSSALANRFLHIDFDVDLETWCQWALSAGIQTELIAFLRFRPELLHDFDPKKNMKAFPTPRSWSFISRMLQSGLPPELEYEVFSGAVGEGATAEFLGFLKIFRKMQSPDAILMNPTGAIVPDEPSELYAIAGALSRKASENTFPRLMEYFKRMPVEYQVLAVNDSLAICPDCRTTREFLQWASDNSDVFI